MSSRKDVMRMILARIGGPHSVTWPGFAITLALAVALNLVTAGMASAEDFRQGLISILIGQSAAYALLVVARWTILSSAKVRPRPVRTLVSFVLACFLGGIASGAAMAVIAAGSRMAPTVSSTPPSPATALIAIGATIVSATVMLSISALVVDTWREHRANLVRAMVLTERIQHLGQQQLLVADEAADAVRTELAAAITQRLSSWTADAQLMSGALSDVVDEVVRPMSRALFVPAAESRVPPTHRVRPDYRNLIIDATTPPLLMPIALAGLVGMLVFFATFLADGPVVALTATGLMLGVVLAVGIAVNAGYLRVVGRLTSLGRLGVLIGALGVIELALAIAWSAFTPLGTQQAHLWALLVVVLIVALMLAVAKLAFAVTLRQQREVAALEERAAWEEARSRMVHWEARSVLAESLHGPVQSALLAAALRVQGLAASEDDAAAWADARQVVDEALKAFSAGLDQDSDVLATLASLRRTWAPLCDIDGEISQDAHGRLATDGVGTRAVSAILVEACSNAVRHARASRIEINIEGDGPATLRITAIDNGSTTAADNPPGGGSALMDAVCLRWERIQTATGSSLIAVLPIAEEP